jgi:hypothetical protein
LGGIAPPPATAGGGGAEAATPGKYMLGFAAARRAVVRVLPFVRGDHRGGVLVRPLHPLLHTALGRRAPVVAPRVWAVLDCLLAVLAPPVAVLEVINLALGEERHARLPLPLLSFLLGLVPV